MRKSLDYGHTDSESHLLTIDVLEPERSCITLPEAIFVPQRGGQHERNQGMIAGDNSGFTISQVTSFSICTAKMTSCTSVFASGTSAQIGGLVGLAVGSHQETGGMWSPLFGLTSDFRSRIRRRLTEWKERTQVGTRDVVVYGGYIEDDLTSRYAEEDRVAYIGFIKEFGALVEKVLGFPPTCIAPSLGFNEKTVALSTQANTLSCRFMTESFMQPELTLFHPSEVDAVVEQYLQRVLDAAAPELAAAA